MGVKVTNNASSVLAGAITTAATTLSVQAGSGAKFPTLAAADWFPLTIVNASGGYEIVRVTARATDVFTITRAQEGTAAQAFAAGCRCDLRLTAAVIADLTVDNAADVPFTPAGNIAATTLQAAIQELDADKAGSAVTITGGGIATGGGSLAADRTITVTKSTQALAQAGADDTTAMTPVRVKDAITQFTATAGRTGSYNDLADKPAIPAQVNADWNASSGAALILNKPTIPAAGQPIPTSNVASLAVGSVEYLYLRTGSVGVGGSVAGSSCYWGHINPWGGDSMFFTNLAQTPAGTWMNLVPQIGYAGTYSRYVRVA